MKIGRRTLLVGAGGIALLRLVPVQPVKQSKSQPEIPGEEVTPTESAAIGDSANATVVKLGGGGFATLTAALASIEDASVDKPYRIEAEPDVNGYEMRNVVWKDHVALHGTGGVPVLFRCELDAAADPLAVCYTLPVRNAGGSRFVNIHVRARNCAYPLDLGDGDGDQAPTLVGCILEHLGNDDIRAYRGIGNEALAYIGSEQRIGTARRARAV